MAVAYTDPRWASYEAPLEKELGLPAGGMAALRTRGERSNSDQVSEAGARTVYQITGGTRNLVMKKYGVDAYKDDKSAARAAALVAKEGLQRTGTWAGAVEQYHGGTDPANYGPRTAAYVARVTGQGGHTHIDDVAYAAPDTQERVSSYIEANWLKEAQGNLKFKPTEHVNTHTSQQDKLDNLNAITGGKDVLHTAPVDHSVSFEDVDKVEAGQQQAQSKVDAMGIHLSGTGVNTHVDLSGPASRLGAAFADNSLTAAFFRRLNEQAPKADPGYAKWRDAHLDDVLSFAKTPEEEDWLLEAQSHGEQDHIQQQIEARRARRELYQGTGVSTFGAVAYGLAGGVLDPLGWGVGAGFGKVAELAGIGGRTLIQAGKIGQGVASLAAENAGTNLALTAALDASGEHYSSRDYASAAAMGATFGTLLSPLSILGRHDTSVADHFGEQAENGLAERAAGLNAAAEKLGPGATVDGIAKEAAAGHTRDDAALVDTNLAPVPDKQMFHNPDNILTSDDGLKTDIQNKYGLDIITDEGSRNLATEAIARAEQRVRDFRPQDYHTILEKVGQESTATTLLNDASPVSKMVGMDLLENPTGAGGRQRTAAISQHIRDKLYMEQARGFEGDYAKFRESRGVSAIGDFRKGAARREFDERVFYETERRMGAKEGQTFDDNPWVNRAADRLYRGYDIMRKDQQTVDSIGSANLGDSSTGYQPHQMNGDVLIDLHRNDRATFNHIRDKVYVEQLMKHNGFDRKFSLKLANRMLEEAMNRKAKGYDVPLHLRSAEASDLVEEAIDAMKLKPEEAQKLKDKFYRGGAAHTKERLRLDLNQPLPNGKRLGDLYKKDVLQMYRGYARRVSGEVALAQYGIMGKKGLEELRNAMFRSGASEKAIQAFDQISAEFLNTPFGKHNHRYLDNMRLLTSTSRLGGMGFTQMAEYGNGIAALGVHRILSSISSTPRLFKEVRAMVKGEKVENPWLQTLEPYTGQVGLEKWDMTRMFDVPDTDIQPFTSEQLSITSRVLRGAAHLQGVLSAHRIIHATQVRGLSEQIVRKTMQFVRTGGMDKHLADMGIDAELHGRLKANIDLIAPTRRGKLDINAGDLTPHEKSVLGQTIIRGANQIIQGTFIGETGPWAHNGLLKTLLQFRTFGVTSIEKQWGRSMVRNGGGSMAAVRSFATLVGASSLAVPLYLARVKLAMVGMDESKRQDYFNKRVNAMQMGRAVLNYTSMSGLASDVYDGVGSFASGSLGIDYGSQVGARGQYSGKVSMGTLVPSLGMVEDGLTGASSLRKSDGSLNTGSASKVLRLLPGSTLPVVQPVINGLTH